MPTAPHIVFKNIDKSEEIEELIYEKIEKLEQICRNITNLSIVIEQPHRHKHTGNSYKVALRMNVPPGQELVIKEEPLQVSRPLKVESLIRNAFVRMHRQLKEFVQRRDLRVKDHPEQSLQAVVVKLFKDEGYGFLRTLDNKEVYFHQNSVLHNHFDRLEEGTGVRFVIEEGLDGTHASTVQIVDKRSKV